MTRELLPMNISVTAITSTNHTILTLPTKALKSELREVFLSILGSCYTTFDAKSLALLHIPPIIDFHDHASYNKKTHQIKYC